MAAKSGAGSLISRATSVAKQVVDGLSMLGQPEESAAPSKQAAAKKAPAKKAPAKKVPAKKVPAQKVTAKKTVAQKAAPAPAKTRTTRSTKTATAANPTPQPARKAMPAKKSSATRMALVVREHETPWTKAELAEVVEHLKGDVGRLSKELEIVEEDLQDLMRDAGDGAGHDQADMGATSFERDQEMTIANNARDMLTQTKHALERIDDGTFGVCEECGEPIGKLRLMAFPRATLCMSCKKREERR